MRNVAILLAITAATSCLADHSPTSTRLGNWTISTREERYAGTIHNSYPIWNMFDGKAETAWVYSGDPKKQMEFGVAPPIGREYEVELAGRAPVRLDEIRIMNGYFKSPEVFKRNNRATKIAIYDRDENVPDTYERLVARVNVDAQMEWTSIPIPDRPYNSIRIVLEEFRIGVDNDVAISEIELIHDGQKVGPKVSNVIAATDGSDCGCGTFWSFYTPAGKLLAETESETDAPAYSNDGRFVAGFSGDWKTRRFMLWSIDTKTAKLRKKWIIAKVDYFGAIIVNSKGATFQIGEKSVSLKN